MVMLDAQRKAKNPRGPVPICPGGKFLPDPSAGDRLLPEHVSKTCSGSTGWLWLLGDTGTAFSASTWSHLRGFQEQRNAAGLINPGDKNPSCAGQWELQSAGGGHWAIRGSYFLWLLP